VPVAPEPAATLPVSWRRWQQAFEAYDGGDEAENFQSVGMRLRECLLSFLDETCGNELAPEGAASPKRGDFKNWTDLLANAVAPGASAARLRTYLKKMSGETWEYVNWLTHAKNAIRMDAEIGLKMVEHLLGCFTAAQMRLSRASTRCEECKSYRVVAGTCGVCGWNDPEYEPVEMPHLTEDESPSVSRSLARPAQTSRRSSHRTISGNRRIGPGLEGGEGRRLTRPRAASPRRQGRPPPLRHRRRSPTRTEYGAGDPRGSAAPACQRPL
jgi:hypothetical protein